MLIEIHMIQNHSPANLNRDDLGAPKTCYFGGVLRSRISSQCIKRSIRMSEEFKSMLGGIRTRHLAQLIVKKVSGKKDVQKRVEDILKECGLEPKKTKKSGNEEEEHFENEKSKQFVYTTKEAIEKMALYLQNNFNKDNEQLKSEFCELISNLTAVPDMALSGRMLETGVLKDTQVEAALQVSHAISTHEARPEVDYYVTKDDITGTGFIDEAMFASACFYKYFSIHWEQLLSNLGGDMNLSAATLGHFIRAAAITNPSGKQNSYAANNLPDGILIEIRNGAPISYANAFAKPAKPNERDLVEQSIAQLGHYVHDLDVGYGKPDKRFWFSPNLHFPLNVRIKDENEKEKEIPIVDDPNNNIKSLDELIPKVLEAIGCDWEEAKKVVVNQPE